MWRACQVGCFSTAMRSLKAKARTHPESSPEDAEHLLHLAVGGWREFQRLDDLRGRQRPEPRQSRDREQIDFSKALLACGHNLDDIHFNRVYASGANRTPLNASFILPTMMVTRIPTSFAQFWKLGQMSTTKGLVWLPHWRRQSYILPRSWVLFTNIPQMKMMTPPIADSSVDIDHHDENGGATIGQTDFQRGLGDSSFVPQVCSMPGFNRDITRQNSHTIDKCGGYRVSSSVFSADTPIYS
ncbi:hypothetical protein F5Y15DRAFT_426084 [Xylariaceae sp. FL0016]|nr:hypothetical protein F5Y15DRAFT_426084 [Xylariaceae sp. FL0016]